MPAHAVTWRDTIAALAVGSLPENERRDAVAHVAGCPACRRAYADLATAVGVVAATAEAPSLSEARAAKLKARVLASTAPLRPVPNLGYATVVPREQLIAFAPGIDWAVLAAPGMTVVYWVFDPSECGSLPPETHPQTQAGVVLAGRMQFHYGDGTRHKLGAGDVYAIAPGTTHGASFEERTVLFDVYTPNHDEFEALYQASKPRSTI